MNRFPKVTPESEGISSRVLLRMMKRLNGQKYLNGVIILRHGHSILEGWVAPYEREVPHQLNSLSKSFTSCAIGLAQTEGRLKITDKLISFFPEYDSVVTDPRMRDVTLRDLLTMRSGHTCCANKYMLGTQDFVKSFLSSPLDTMPGTVFTYNSGATYMLSAVIRKVTGENVREYLIPRLFEPLEISPGIWDRCPRGIDLGGWSLHLTTDDLAKFAHLLLHHGEWNGKQLLPADYLAEATQKQADNSANQLPDWQQGYGYQFWISRHGFRGDGAAGQLAVVLEEQELCIAVTSCLYGDSMQDQLDILWEELLPALRNAPLPEDPEALKELQDYVSSMKIPVPETPPAPPHAAARFDFLENPAGIRRCEITFGVGNCALTFFTDRGIEQLRAGFGHFEKSILQLTDSRPHPLASYARWTAPETLEILSLLTDSTYRDVWTVNFADAEEPLKLQASGTFRPGAPRLLTKQ